MGSLDAVSFPSSGHYIDELKRYIENPAIYDIRIVRAGSGADLAVVDRFATPTGRKRSAATLQLFGESVVEKRYDVKDSAFIMIELQRKLFEPTHLCKNRQLEQVVSQLLSRLNRDLQAQKEHVEANQRLTAYLLGRALSNYSEQHGLISISRTAQEISAEIQKPREPKNLPLEIARFAPYVTILDKRKGLFLTVGYDGMSRVLEYLHDSPTIPKRATTSYPQNLDSAQVVEKVIQFQAAHPHAELTHRLLACMSGNAIGSVTKGIFSLLKEAKNHLHDLDRPLAISGDSTLHWLYQIDEEEIVVTVTGAASLRGEAEVELLKVFKEAIGKRPLTHVEQATLSEKSFLAEIGYKIIVTFSKKKASSEPVVRVQYKTPRFAPSCDQAIVTHLTQGYARAFI